ncbi:MAG: glycosyltransferase family 4 protein [Magnetococcales bacterium]|nr:glycosyltransferase family 4 protein [Magnetococcales bacterium]
MRLLLVHNRYRQRGGEDRAFDLERQALLDAGVTVESFLRDNDGDLPDAPGLASALGAIWSPAAFRALGATMDRFRPEVIHAHNLFPLISPSLYDAARARGVPVVQTLHNFRLGCVNGLFFHQGQTCTRCLHRSLPWPGVVRGCYRESRAASGAVATLIGVHRLLGTWRRKVTLFRVLSHASRERFITLGLPPERLVVCPNLTPPPPPPRPLLPPGGAPRNGVLFVGRLSPEKGVELLLDLWRAGGAGLPPLTLLGDGPLSGLADHAPPGATFVGRVAPEAVAEAMERAAFLVIPSLCWENFPMVAAEAMARGLPMLASRGGALEEMIDHGATGLLLPPGDRAAWAAAIGWAAEHPQELAAMGRRAQQTAQQRFSEARVRDQLLGWFEEAMRRERERAGRRGISGAGTA